MPPTALIVGAGPTGLTLAHELARHGVPVRIVEKRDRPSETSRALGIHARILEIFEVMGVVHSFLAIGHRVPGGAFYSGARRLARIPFGGLPSRYPFVLIVPQSETERLLEAALARYGVRVERQVELTALQIHPAEEGRGVTATLAHADGRTEEASADWLIGCDGAHSTVRHALGLPFEGTPYPDPFLLADVRIGGGLVRDDEIGIFTGPRGLIATFPFGDGRCRIVASGPPDYGPTPTLAQCQEHIDRLAPRPGLFPLGDPTWTALFHIHHRAAPAMRRGPVFLAGDAVHIHSPAGGQGMNSGIQDAFNLAWKLALAASGQAAPALLDTYQSERLPIDRAVVRKADLLTRFATLGFPLRAVRDLLFPLIAAATPLPASGAAVLSQIALRYGPGPAIEDHGPFRGTAAGRRAPDLLLTPAGEGTNRTLFRQLAAGRSLLLLAHPPAVTDGMAALLAGLPIELFLISQKENRAEEIARAYGTSPAAYLIRPDGVIGFRAPLAAVPRLLPAYLARLFHPR